eukprot:gene40466-64376_t
MSSTRRSATLGLLAAGALAAPVGSAIASEGPETAQTEQPDREEPATRLDTGESRSDHMMAP